MAEIKNHLLLSLTDEDLQRLKPRLEPITLGIHDYLERREQPIGRVCFPDDGVLSVVTRNERGHDIEAGTIGFEGMSGLTLLMGDDRSPNETYVQVQGAGHTMTAESLKQALAASATLKDRLLQYAHTFLCQVAQTALTNGQARIPERLARWLLMVDDRVSGAKFDLTHEFLATMLGVGRPRITDALHILEGERLIRNDRGLITVRDRGGLETLARGFYGVAEAQYNRLFGKPWRSSDASTHVDGSSGHLPSTPADGRL